ncbi:MAG: molybdopterin-dependent oxidoreductase [Thermodesulfobacteriota bacterium]
MADKRIVRSACQMCHGGCQVLVHLEGDKVVKVTGDPQSPVSKGFICPKGAASPELLYHPDRILQPLRRRGGKGENKWERITWDEALDEMAGKLDGIRKQFGPWYFGMMHGTGRPYENLGIRFANAFGTPNMTGVAHLCFWPRIHANLATQGMSEMPVCDVYASSGVKPECLVIWGCNITGPIGHHSADGMCGGILTRAMKSARKVIVIDPRRVVNDADLWLGLRPGTDGALALAMIHVIIREDLVDHEFVRKYTVGFEELREHVKSCTPEWAAAITRLSPELISEAARTYATVKPACMQWGNGIDHSRCNFHTARSLLILRAITGNLHRPGGDIIYARPEGFRIRSAYHDHRFAGIQFLPLENMAYALDSEKQAMRLPAWHRFLRQQALKPASYLASKFYDRVGPWIENRIGMVNMMANLHNLRGSRYPMMPIVHPPAFWESIVSGDPYRLKAFWIIGSNPLVSMSNSLMIEKALQLLEYVVVTDFFLTPTAQFADLFLPACTWMEYNDIHTSGGHTYSLMARKALTKVGDTMEPQECMLRLAQRLGLKKAFPWKNLREIGEWMLAGTGCGYEEFFEKGILVNKPRVFGYQTEKHFFKTPSGKFEIYAKDLMKMGIEPLPVYREPALSPVSTPETAKNYPLILIGGVKIPQFFISEGRQISSLRRRMPDPMVQIYPATAQSLGINDNDWVWVETTDKRVKMRAAFFDGMAEDTVCAQFAWWFPEEDPPEHGWKRSSLNQLFGKMSYDPETGSESLKCSLCRIYPDKEK